MFLGLVVERGLAVLGVSRRLAQRALQLVAARRLLLHQRHHLRQLGQPAVGLQRRQLRLQLGDARAAPAQLGVAQLQLVAQARRLLRLRLGLGVQTPAARSAALAVARAHRPRHENETQTKTKAVS